MRLERAATGPSGCFRVVVRAARSGSRVSILGGLGQASSQGPSLTGHHMLPRTTQQSPSAAPSGRVSDRTMVGPEPPCGLRSTQPPNPAVPWTEDHSSSLPPQHSTHHAKGLDARELPSLPPRVKHFLLTSPSIEPAPGARALQDSRECRGARLHRDRDGQADAKKGPQHDGCAHSVGAARTAGRDCRSLLLAGLGRRVIYYRHSAVGGWRRGGGDLGGFSSPPARRQMSAPG